jgi:hypothetical protein
LKLITKHSKNLSLIHLPRFAQMQSKIKMILREKNGFKLSIASDQQKVGWRAFKTRPTNYRQTPINKKWPYMGTD